MKRTEIKEECNDFKKDVKDCRILFSVSPTIHAKQHFIEGTDISREEQV